MVENREIIVTIPAVVFSKPHHMSNPIIVPSAMPIPPGIIETAPMIPENEKANTAFCKETELPMEITVK